MSFSESHDQWADEKRWQSQREDEEQQGLLSFCRTEDEYLAVQRGDAPLAVVRRRDAYHGHNQKGD